MKYCSQDPSMLDIICEKDDDCPMGEPVVNGNGKTQFLLNYMYMI